MNDVMVIFLIGAGATAITDLWTVVRRAAFGTPLPNFGMLGRWIAQLARGRFRAVPIASVPPVRAERVIGWSAHYSIGIAFAFLLPTIWGWEWLRHPTFMPAMMVGIATVIAPLFVMHPGMGMGFAASRTPRPAAARFQSLVTHAVFGLGLYLAASFLPANGMMVF